MRFFNFFHDLYSNFSKRLNSLQFKLLRSETLNSKQTLDTASDVIDPVKSGRKIVAFAYMHIPYWRQSLAGSHKCPPCYKLYFRVF